MAGMPKPTADQLKNIPLFASVDRDDRAVIASGMDVADVPVGQTVIEEGQPNDAVYLVASGELEVLVGRERRQTLRPGDFFGEISVGRGTNTTASVVAKSASTLYVLAEDALAKLLENPEAVLRIRGAMTNREAADRLFGAR